MNVLCPLFLTHSLTIHDQLQVGQVFSSWSNVSRLRFDQHVGQVTNLWQWVTLTLTKIWLAYDQDMTMMLVKSSPPSNDQPMTKIWAGILGLSYKCTEWCLRGHEVLAHTLSWPPADSNKAIILLDYCLFTVLASIIKCVLPHFMWDFNVRLNVILISIPHYHIIIQMKG